MKPERRHLTASSAGVAAADVSLIPELVKSACSEVGQPQSPQQRRHRSSAHCGFRFRTKCLKRWVFKSQQINQCFVFRLFCSDFLSYLSTPKVANTNPNCVLKTDILCDRAPPTVTFTLLPAVQGNYSNDLTQNFSNAMTNQLSALIHIAQNPPN